MESDKKYYKNLLTLARGIKTRINHLNDKIYSELQPEQLLKLQSIVREINFIGRNADDKIDRMDRNSRPQFKDYLLDKDFEQFDPKEVAHLESLIGKVPLAEQLGWREKISWRLEKDGSYTPIHPDK